MTFEEDDDFDEVVPIQVPRWIKQTDRVIDAYKSEVETIRVRVNQIQAQYDSLQDDIATLKELHKQLTLLLESDV